MEDYIALAILLAKAIDTTHVFIATEDATDVEKASELLREAGLEPYYQPWRRAAYSRAMRASGCDDGNGDGFTRIERAMDQASVDAEGILLSALADITMLADAAAIVGGISTFTNLAQRLGAARSGIPMPWIDVGSRQVREWVQQRWEAENEGSWLESTAETLAAAWSGEPEAAEKAAMSATGGEEVGGGGDECPTEAELTAHLDLDGDGEVLSLIHISEPTRPY